MRQIASVKGNEEVKRVMICDTPEGVYLFYYDKEEDCSAMADELCESIEDAMT